MLGFYRTLEFLTSMAVVCDIWTDVWGRWMTALWDPFVITERLSLVYNDYGAYRLSFTDSCRAFSRSAF